MHGHSVNQCLKEGEGEERGKEGSKEEKEGRKKSLSPLSFMLPQPVLGPMLGQMLFTL